MLDYCVTTGDFKVVVKKATPQEAISEAFFLLKSKRYDGVMLAEFTGVRIVGSKKYLYFDTALLMEEHGVCFKKVNESSLKLKLI